jgi:ornithine cyclodeaminase/alanine dehydrogenase-like protein (mu-crystallin family)
MAGSAPTPVVVAEDRIRELVTEADALASARAAFEAMATEGAVQQPPPMGYDLPENEVEIHVKGAALAGAPAMAVKMATGGYKNRERGLGPAGAGLVVIVDTYTGYPAAVLLENAYLTDMRTAAAGALASMLLVAPEPSAGCTLAIVGAGVQARLHARSVTSAMPGRFSKVVLWARRPEQSAAAAETIAAELAEMDGNAGVAVSSAATVEEAVAGAELVVTVTPSREALVEAAWLHPAATVVAVGSDGVGKREVGDSVLEGASLCVMDQNSLTLGDLQFAPASQQEAAVPLGDILLGKHPGRTGGDGIVLADLTGCGAQDAAIGAEVWAKIQAQQAKL